MKVLLLSDINSSHTKKWAIELAGKGIEIGIFSLSSPKDNWNEQYKNISVFCPLKLKHQVFQSGLINKLKYLKAIPLLKKIIKQYKPDLLHAHYASSYGLIGTFAKFHPYIVYVWGSDVFDFPHHNFLNKKLIAYVFSKADKIISISHIMAKEINKYTNKDITVIPFGVDIEKFKPFKAESIFNESDIVIGTIKTLETKYGIEYLIDAFKIVSGKYPHLPLKLMIGGSGSLDLFLKEKVKTLNISDKVVFTGQISLDKVPMYHNMISIFVQVSVLDSESFGVSVVEASACAKPVVVSNVGGLKEVIDNEVTGLVVKAKNSEETAAAIERLINDKPFAKLLAENGREKVERLYSLADNVNSMVELYKTFA